MVKYPLNSEMDNGFKKGAWDEEEDKKLKDYIEEHGQGRWTSVPKRAGLKRCGKSCRLRWKNYLRPDIRRGNFSPQEEHTIIHLHSTHGNKWAKIATHLPGRTDNEIKNFWNTHLSKKLVCSGIDPKTHLPTTNSVDFLPNPSLGNQLANIMLLQNIFQFLNSNPLPLLLVGSQISHQLHAVPEEILNPLNVENSGLLSGDYQPASLPPEHGRNPEFFLPGLIPATAEISSGTKPQCTSVYDYSSPLQNYEEQVSTSTSFGSSWEAAVDDDDALWKDIFCDSFPSSSL